MPYGRLMSVQIKAATKSDVPYILEFIRELAIFEQLENEVFATEES